MKSKKQRISTSELDPDLLEKAIKYQTQAIRLQYTATIIALAALTFIAIAAPALGHLDVSFGDIGSFIGGTSAPLMAFAGFLMLFVALTSQQSQTILQHQAIRNQNNQFTIQAFDNSFFNLLNHYLSFVGNYTIQIQKEPHSIIAFKRKLDYWRPYFKEQMSLTGSSSDIPPRELQQWLFNQFVNQQNQVKNLFKPLISMLFFIEEENISDKEKYYRMLDYQVTESEKFILFYFFITTPKYFTNEEIPVVNGFLKRFDTKTLIHPDHIAWLDV